MSVSQEDVDYEADQWVSLPDPPHTLNMPKTKGDDRGYFSNAVSVNNEIVVSSKREYSSRRITFYKYSSFTRKWDEFNICEHSDCRMPHGYFLTMDEERKLFYLFEGRNKINSRRINAFEVWIGDMITNHWWPQCDRILSKFTDEVVDEIPVEIHHILDQYPAILEDNQSAQDFSAVFGVSVFQKQLWKGVVIADGIVHLFVVNRLGREEFQLRHFVLGEDVQDFTELFIFALHMEAHDDTDNVEDVMYDMTFFAVFVSRLNCILLIHGGDRTKKGAVWKFALKNLIWRKEHGLDIPICTSSGTLTGDQKHVVFAGVNHILVLDISDGDNFKIRKSSMMLPMQMDVKTCNDSMVRTGGGLWNEMLMSGWTRSLFKTKRFAHLSFPPLYLLQMIGHWISMEELHFIYRSVAQGSDGSDIPHWPRHFMIPMERVLKVTSCVLTQDLYEYVNEE